MKITIIGGGNIGTLIAGQLANKGNEVLVYTKRKNDWNKKIIIIDQDEGVEISCTISKITDNKEEALSNTELIFFTVPASITKQMISELENYISPETKICFYPGTGGVEFCCQKLLKKNCIIFGTQRVCSVARLEEYGHKVRTNGKRGEMYLATLNDQYGENLRDLFEELFEIKTYLLPNYLSVTLTPSNPILHTSRLYSLFKDYNGNNYYRKIPLFYEEWDEDSSKLLIQCDRELHNVCSKIDLNLINIKPLLEHYESKDHVELTNKITSIKSFKGLETPHRKSKSGFYPDLESRYFTADFPYGLLIIKSFALIVNCDTPSIDMILYWYQKLVGKKYLNELGLDKDSQNLNLPQNIGIKTMNEVVEFYKKY